MADPNIDPAVAVCFSVKLGVLDLGTFTACEGLGFEVTVEPVTEGGNHLFIHQLPGRIKYTNIKLTRAVTKDTAKVASWVASMASKPVRTTASITAMTSLSQPVATWSLIGVIPIKWTGPQLSVDSPKVATETLELAHHGFDPSAGA